MAYAFLNGTRYDTNETPVFSDPKEWDLYKVVGRGAKRRDHIVYIWAPNNMPSVKGSDYAEKIYRLQFWKNAETVTSTLVRNGTKKMRSL
jgi:hypothetical protein